jgi:hypothetical protein
MCKISDNQTIPINVNPCYRTATEMRSSIYVCGRNEYFTLRCKCVHNDNVLHWSSGYIYKHLFHLLEVNGVTMLIYAVLPLSNYKMFLKAILGFQNIL